MISYFKAGSSLHSEKYRPDIDGLRAVAVGSVVICHAFPAMLPGGFVGVDIFFVISGYLISSILIKEFNNNSFSILNFYNRRIRRIFPSLIAVLLFIVFFGWFCLFRPEFAVLGQHIDASTLFSENFLLWSESSYFDVASDFKPTLHLWSLAIEEQFYIFWPILLYFAHRKRIDFALIFVLFAGTSFAINVHDINSEPTAAYYSPIGRCWELMIGSGLAYIQVNRPSLLAQYKDAQSLIGLLLILTALLFIDTQSRFPGVWALLPTAGSLLLISSGRNGWVNRHMLSLAPMVWCGLISYPLYLWHWPLLSFGHIVFSGLSNKKIIVLVLAAVIASVFTFLFIEQPFRQRGNSTAKALLLLAMMLVPLTCGALLATRVIPPRLGDFDVPTRNEWDFLIDRTPNFGNGADGIFRLEADRPHLVLFIGDSHVAQYAERIDKVIAAEPKRPGAVLAITGGCIPIEGVATDNVRRADCWPLRKRAYKMALESRFQTVVIGAAWNWYFLASDYTYDANGKSVALISSRGRTAAIKRLSERIQALIHAGKKVILLLDNPADSKMTPSLDGIRLSLTATNFKPDRTIRIDKKQLELERQLLALAKRTGATVIDPFAAVCTEDVCRITSGTGRPIYKDRGHLNPDWAIDHADFIDATVAR